MQPEPPGPGVTFSLQVSKKVPAGLGCFLIGEGRASTGENIEVAWRERERIVGEVRVMVDRRKPFNSEREVRKSIYKLMHEFIDQSIVK